MDRHFESQYPERSWFSTLEQLARYIKEGKSVQLLSIPGVGRSTILGLLTNNKKIQKLHFAGQDVHFILVNFQEVKQKPLHEVMEFLFLSLCESLRIDKTKEYQKINGLFRQSLKLKDELVLFQALKEAIEYLSFERKMKIVFLFDKFEEFTPFVTSEFFTNLKSLRYLFKYQFCVVFSINRALVDIVDESVLSDFYEYVTGHEVYLSLYDSVTTKARVKYIENITKKKISVDLFNKIIEQTRGVGRLVKLSVEAAISQEFSIFNFQFSNKSQNTNTKDFSEFLFSQKSIQNALSDICKSLLPVEQNCLIRQKFDDEKAVDYLENVGILKTKQITIPQFTRHIEMHRQERESEAEKIVFSESSNTIQKGEMIISDQLTSSEYKLLSYLVKAPDRIINRDEIIEIVWSDVKSTAGITDQAVDQLVFRLRRKIEEDPNNPEHLQTVKGRGFRFNP